LDLAIKSLTDARAPFGVLSYGLTQEHVYGLSKLSALKSLKAFAYYTPNVDDGASLIFRDAQGNIIQTVFNLAASQEVLHASVLAFVEQSHTLNSTSGPSVSVYTYPLVNVSPPFALEARLPAVFGVEDATIEPNITLPVRSAINMAYTRTLAVFRRTLGPWFDLEHLWDKHCYFEFTERDSVKTMATMVSTPYVNHIPTMTGGTGFRNLSLFYKHHFMHASPPDTEIIPISRTVGVDRLVDEFIFRFTHTTEVDYLLPGVKPTGKSVEIPMIGVIAFRGDKLTFEHIYWDQASTLVQLGLLEPKGLPVAGVEVAHKMVSPFAMPSNTLLEKWKATVSLPL